MRDNQLAGTQLPYCRPHTLSRCHFAASRAAKGEPPLVPLKFTRVVNVLGAELILVAANSRHATADHTENDANEIPSL